MTHGAAGRGTGGAGSPATILGGGRGRSCQRARLDRETGRDAGDAGAAGLARGRGWAGALGLVRGAKGVNWALGGRGRRGSRVGPRELGWAWFWFSGFGFSILPFLFANSLQFKPNKLIEFKLEFEFNPNTQTNKIMLQHECINKVKPKKIFNY